MDTELERHLTHEQIVDCREIRRSAIKVALYLRVSTSRQETKNQAVQLREFARTQNWKIVAEYCDDGVSGKHSDRPQFRKMFDDASRREFDLILFWSLDRFSREGVYQTLQHLNQLESHGVGFRSFTESYFSSCGAFKDAVIAIMATLAKQERIKISERTVAGLQRARAAGKILGRPRRQIDTAKIRRLRRAGNSWRQIAAALGASTATLLYRVRPRLRNARRNRG